MLKRIIFSLAIALGMVAIFISPSAQAYPGYTSAYHQTDGNDQAFAVYCRNNGAEKWMQKGQWSSDKCPNTTPWAGDITYIDIGNNFTVHCRRIGDNYRIDIPGVWGPYLMPDGTWSCWTTHN